MKIGMRCCQSYQDMSSQGVFYVTPKSSGRETLPDLRGPTLEPDVHKDKFEIRH